MTGKDRLIGVADDLDTIVKHLSKLYPEGPIFRNTFGGKWTIPDEVVSEMLALKWWDWRVHPLGVRERATGATPRPAIPASPIPQPPVSPMVFGTNLGLEIGFDKLFEVARKFDVSVEAVIWQIGFVDNIPLVKRQPTM